MSLFKSAFLNEASNYLNKFTNFINYLVDIVVAGAPVNYAKEVKTGTNSLCN